MSYCCAGGGVFWCIPEIRIIVIRILVTTRDTASAAVGRRRDDDDDYDDDDDDGAFMDGRGMELISDRTQTMRAMCFCAKT